MAKHIKINGEWHEWDEAAGPIPDDNPLANPGGRPNPRKSLLKMSKCGIWALAKEFDDTIDNDPVHNPCI